MILPAISQYSLVNCFPFPTCSYKTEACKVILRNEEFSLEIYSSIDFETKKRKYHMRRTYFVIFEKCSLTFINEDEKTVLMSSDSQGRSHVEAGRGAAATLSPAVGCGPGSCCLWHGRQRWLPFRACELAG